MIKGVRALARGIEVLRALNRQPDATVVELSAATGLSRSTIHRLIQTFVDAGIVRRIPNSDRVCLTAVATELTAGYDETARAVELSQPLIERLATEVLWPVDIHALSGGASVVRGSTAGVARISPFQVDPGVCLPVLGSAGGRALITDLNDADRREVIADAAHRWESDARIAAKPGAVERLIEEIHKRGYAFREGGYQPQTCSIALPIKKDGAPLIGVSMIFYRSALPVEEAAEKYLPALKGVVDEVERMLVAPPETYQKAGSR